MAYRLPRLFDLYHAILVGVIATAMSFTFASHGAASETGGATVVCWPEVSQSARPWTRWWWHGSAVDEANLSRLLKTYHAAGLGGVEITCIYGVKGNGEYNRDYLSDEWVAAVQHAVQEAKRLGMGVDLPAGSGWRMGGPTITPEFANSRVLIESTKVQEGENFAKQFERQTPQVVVARNGNGKQIFLTDQIQGNAIEWQAPAGEWTVYTMAYRWAGDRVKRPGPGGAGLNINPFSQSSVLYFLNHFGKTLEKLPGLRAQFHDSFEYEGDWQPRFLDEFAERRGYRLEHHLATLAGDGPAELVGRVKCDYRETLSDLVLDELVKTWVAWAHDHGQLARNQSHGSPANWLDLYAACDIPETESFGRLEGGDGHRLVFKFASSAANVMGRQLVSSETATWLDEHFTVTLADVKEIVDRQMLAGVNHVFYHGTAYSPEDAHWPGWLFYASTQLNPQNSIWHDFPALNEYVARCQSVLQQAKPDNDVLLYWPLYDMWHKQEGLRMDLRVHNSSGWLDRQPIGEAAELLDAHGYAFDYVSDRGLAACDAGENDSIQSPGGTYTTVVVPKAEHMPVATLEQLVTLAVGGANIVFWGEMPESPPGMAGATLDTRWTKAIAKLEELQSQGCVRVHGDLVAALRDARVRHETWGQNPEIGWLRKRFEGRPCYLLKNHSDRDVDTWMAPAARGNAAVLLDPMSGAIGLAATRPAGDDGIEVRVQLEPGQTVFMQLLKNDQQLPVWPYAEPNGPAVALHGNWNVDFIEGGPTLPESFQSAAPVPWTEAPDAEAQRFAGTVRYSTTFDAPQHGGRWQLDLGEVAGSARVHLNGQLLATLISPPFTVDVPTLESSQNQLAVEVTGVAANRIRDLDRRGVEWRIFEDINLVNIDYKPFDASDWPVQPLGLHGPVTLTPLASPEPRSGE